MISVMAGCTQDARRARPLIESEPCDTGEDIFGGVVEPAVFVFALSGLAVAGRTSSAWWSAR